MPCIFCRSSFHNKTNCNDESVIRHQNSRISSINTIVDSACNRGISRVDYESEMKRWLRHLTVIELKMVIECYKRTTFADYGNPTTKDMLINVVLVFVLSQHYTRLSTRLTAFTTVSPRPAARLAPAATTPPPAPARVAPPARPAHVGEWIPANRPANIPTPGFAPLPRPLNLPQTQTPSRAPTYTVYKFEDKGNEEECPVCYEDLQDESFVKLNCSHQFCKSCIRKCIYTNHFKFPLCRETLTKIYTQNPIVKMSI